MLNGGGGLNPDGLSLDLQFAADKTMTPRKGPRPDFTRGSTGTFVGSNGLIQTAAVNAARFDHNPVSPFACRGLLIEESRTNLLQRSEEFGNAYWATTRATVTTDAATSPDGTTTADKLIADTTAASNHRVDRPTITLALNTVHTVSIFAKAAEYTGLALGVGLSATEGVRFSLVGAGTATPVAAGNTGTIQQLPNGWYRCTCTFTSDATTATHRVAIYIGQNGTTTSYTGDGTSGIFIWGAQLEAGSFATSYIPTTTSSLTRSADVCSYSNVSSFYNPAAGTLVGDLILYTPSPSNTTELFRFGSGNNRIQLGVTNVASEAIRPFITSGGTTTYNSTQGTIVAGTSRKVALTFATNDAISCLNGTLGTQDTSVTMPVSISTAAIGSGALTGHIAAIRYYKKRLPNAKLVTLTT